MTKKDYIVIAKAIFNSRAILGNVDILTSCLKCNPKTSKQAEKLLWDKKVLIGNDICIDALMRNMCHLLKENNPKFKVKEFYRAVYK